MNDARNAALAGAPKEKLVLVGKVNDLALTLREVKSNLGRISSSINRLSLAPPRPVAPVAHGDQKGSPEQPHSLELRLDEVQMSANDVCREAGYLADRLDKLV